MSLLTEENAEKKQEIKDSFFAKYICKSIHIFDNQWLRNY